MARAESRECGTERMPPAPPLALEARLQWAAAAHSQDMADHREMSHAGSDGSNPAQRIARVGYRSSAWGENVAWGYRSVASVMAGWLASPGHCKNIMNPNFTELGAAEVNYYWTQVFARPQ